MPYKFGRRPTPPSLLAILPQLSGFVQLKPAPPSFSVSPLGGVYPMDLNDSLGDCLCAGAAHMEQVFSAQVDGTPYVPSDAEVLVMYEALGYRPGHPSTDQGGTIPQALEVWRRLGVGGRKIKGWAEVNVSNLDQVMAACAEFSGLYAGLNVPYSAIAQFDRGETWDVVAPNDGGIAGGHLTPILGYSPAGVVLVTWGRVQWASWAFFRRYYDEVAVVIPQDYDRLPMGKLINGETEAALITAIDSIGGNIPVPVPPPAPTPSPGPAPGPLPPKPPPGVLQWLRDLLAWLERLFG